MLLKKFLVFAVIFSFIFLAFQIPAEGIEVSAASAIVMSADSGEIFFEKDAHKKRSMASTTKIMTAVIALESDKTEDVVKVNSKMVAVEGTSMGLKSGDRITLKNLIKGMMLLSGNDSANAIALYLAGSAENFAEMMNEKAKKIGMEETNFVTASGLDDEEHYTTAYDMALLTSYAMKNPDFRDIVSLSKGQVEYISPHAIYTYYNHNKFLSMYEGACGVKTGFTKKSGRCLVTAVERDGNRLICVTLNAGDDWNDHKKIYDYCFSTGQFFQPSDTFNTLIPVTGGYKSEIIAHAEYIPNIFTSSDSRIYTKICTDKFLYAPVTKGDQVGSVKFYRDGVLVKEIPLIANESTQIKEYTQKRKNKLFNFFYEIYKKLSGD